jgi:hypothetical protein
VADIELADVHETAKIGEKWPFLAGFPLRLRR